MQIITIANQKGGSGKTATAAALAQCAAKDGRKVLAVDLDPQGNLSFTLGANMDSRSSFDLLNGTSARKAIQKCGPVSVIPSSWANSTVTTKTGSARRLQAAIAPIKGEYDLIIIDTPPTAGELQYNALQASTGLIIPLQADIFNLQGLHQMAETAARFTASNPALSLTGIVITRHNPRSTIARQMQATIEDTAAALAIPFLGTVREGVAVREAEALQLSLYDYAPKSNPARDYQQIYNLIIGG